MSENLTSEFAAAEHAAAQQADGDAPPRPPATGKPPSRVVVQWKGPGTMAFDGRKAKGGPTITIDNTGKAEPGPIDTLLIAIEDRLAATRTTLDLSIDASDGAGISWLHRNAEVLNKELHEGRFDMTVRVDETKRDIVVSRFDAVPHVA